MGDGVKRLMKGNQLDFEWAVFEWLRLAGVVLYKQKCYALMGALGHFAANGLCLYLTSALWLRLAGVVLYKQKCYALMGALGHFAANGLCLYLTSALSMRGKAVQTCSARGL